MAKKTDKTVETSPLQPSFLSFKPNADKVKSAYVQKDRPAEPCWAKLTFARDESGNVKTELPRAIGDWQRPATFVVNLQLFQNGKLDKPFFTMNDYIWEEHTVALSEEEIAIEIPETVEGYAEKRALTLTKRGEQFSKLMGQLQQAGLDAKGNELSADAVIEQGAGYILAPGNVFFAVWCPRARNSKDLPKSAQIYKRGDGGVLIPLYQKSASGDVRLNDDGKPIPVVAKNQDQVCLVAPSSWGHGEARDLRQYARALADGAKYREANGGGTVGGQQLPEGMADDAESGADPGHIAVDD